MSCSKPTRAWQDLETTSPLGAHPVYFSIYDLDPKDYEIRFDKENHFATFVSRRYRQLDLPCGKCLLCRKARSWEIAVRAWCEWKSNPFQKACFITLTVDDAHMQEVFPDGFLRHRPWQLFAKRLRKEVGPFRFMMCGEYGEHTKRPHYHATIFGHDFTDRTWDFDQVSFCDSPLLAKIWKYGQVQCRPVEENSIMYVAGYQLKSCDLDIDEDEVDDDEVMLKSYVRWSRRPGLGLAFIEKYPGTFFERLSECSDGSYCKDISPSIILNGHECHFDGRYFKKKLACIDPAKYDKMQVFKERRLLREQLHSPSYEDVMKAQKVLWNRVKVARHELAKRKRDLTVA